MAAFSSSPYLFSIPSLTASRSAVIPMSPVTSIFFSVTPALVSSSSSLPSVTGLYPLEPAETLMFSALPLQRGSEGGVSA